MKEKAKDKFLNNFILKLFAVVLAIVIWLVVMNVEDYTVTKQIDDIPVEQLNGNIFNELDQVYDVTKGDTVDIIVRGPRTVVDRLTADDFYATADLSTMSITNTVQIFVEPKDSSIASDITITYVDNTMVLSLEEKVTKQLPVTVVVEGETADGYAVAEYSATPNLITIEGAKSVINKITEIRVTVDASNKYEEFEDYVEPVCYNAYGEVVENKDIVFDCTEVLVNVKIYPTKSVPVNLSTVGSVANGYGISDISYHPDYILIAGEESVLRGVSSIDIDDIRVTGSSESIETNVDIEDYLPNNVYLADTSSQITVSITIEQLEDRNFVPVAGDVTLLNTDERYDYELVFPEGYQIVLRGLNRDVSELTIESLNLSVDCGELQTGSNMVSISVSESELYRIINDMQIEVIVTEKTEDETDTSSENNSTESDTDSDEEVSAEGES